jgi:hypothetical protein
MILNRYKPVQWTYQDNYNRVCVNVLNKFSTPCTLDHFLICPSVCLKVRNGSYGQVHEKVLECIEIGKCNIMLAWKIQHAARCLYFGDVSKKFDLLYRYYTNFVKDCAFASTRNQLVVLVALNGPIAKRTLKYFLKVQYQSFSINSIQ